MVCSLLDENNVHDVKGNKMEVQIVLCIDVDLDKMPDKVKEACKVDGTTDSQLEGLILTAMRGTVENILNEHWSNESAFRLVCAIESSSKES